MSDTQELTQTERFLLEWLAKDDGQYGECHGPTLDRLVDVWPNLNLVPSRPAGTAIGQAVASRSGARSAIRSSIRPARLRKNDDAEKHWMRGDTDTKTWQCRHVLNASLTIS